MSLNDSSYLTDRVSVQDKHVLIVGTQKPWIEALALEAGAAKTTSFGKIDKFKALSNENSSIGSNCLFTTNSYTMYTSLANP